MHGLRLFGGASLEVLDADGDVPPRARQRHRLALLALLAVESRGLSRDKLIGYLWPESDESRARNLLSVSLYVLRNALGEEALLSPGDDVRLNPEALRIDVVEFERALERDDHEGAVELPDGPFLDGFFLPDAREFGFWVDRQRNRLGRAYAEALEVLARSAEEAGDAAGAVAWWERRAAHDRFDSRVAVRLMQALEAAGNRARALELADVHAALLREEFGTEPDPSVSELAERLRGAPFGASGEEEPAETQAATGRTVAPTAETTAPAAEMQEPASVPTSPPPRNRGGSEPARRPASRRMPSRRLVVAALGGIIALAALLWAGWPRGTVPERSIAVLPFASMSPESRGDFLADGVTEEIIAHLSSVSDLKVISRTSAMRYRGTDLSTRRIADELNVAHLLEGSVRRTNGRVRITAQLIDGQTGYQHWSSTYEGELTDIFGLQEDVAREVAQALAPRLGAGGSVAPARRGTRDAEALELFLRGRYHWKERTREGHERARGYFERAIERDSAYADPYAGLAFTYLTGYQLGFSDAPEDETYSRIKWAAERALALDESSADAHVALAVALWWQWNWPGAERELLRALELNPGHATARTWYSLLLMGWGRLEAALREIRRAEETDPFAVVTSANYASVLYLTRRYDRAIEQGYRTMELDPDWGYPIVALSHSRKGDPEEATRVLRRALQAGPDTAEAPAHLDEGELLAVLAYVRATAGDREEAIRFLRRATERDPEPFDVARAYVALGAPDSALAWLRRSPWQWPHRANRFDPALDPLRDDPRFERMSNEVKRDLGIP